MSKLTELLLALSLALAALTAEAREWAQIESSGLLIAATEGAYPPFNYFAGRELKGYEVELMEALAKRLALKLEWRTLGFDALIAALGQERFDVAIASHAITAERAKAVDFLRPHYCSGGRIVARKGGPLTAAALKGKVLGVQLATTYADAARKAVQAAEVRSFPRDSDAQQALLAQRVDAWLTDRFVAAAAQAKNPAADLVLGEMLFVERVGGIVRKGNRELRDKLDGALLAMQNDGSLRALSLRHFKEDVLCRD